MSFGDVMAFAALMGAMIAVVAILADIYKRRLDFQQRKLELVSTGKAEDARRFETRCAELEQRLRVLERIVTDAGGNSLVAMQIEAQIEALRDSDTQEVSAQ